MEVLKAIVIFKNDKKWNRIAKLPLQFLNSTIQG